MSAVDGVKPDPLEVLGALLRGQASAGGALANTLRADAFGLTAFGRTDALDLFASHPLVLSATPHVLAAAHALAVLDETPAGRCIGVFADLADGVISRVWVVAATAADAHAEAAVPVARDDFLSQLRVHCHGDAVDHPGLEAAAWPDVLSLGIAALAGPTDSADPADPPAASSSHAVVVRAFGSGGRVAALYSLRVLENSAPRRAHFRLALAIARRDATGQRVHSQMAVSDVLPEPAPVFFTAP